MSSSARLLFILHPGALGDALLASTAIHALKNRFPDHRLVWFGHKEVGKVFASAQLVHQAYSFETLPVFSSEKSLERKEGWLDILFNRCVRLVGWLADTDGLWQRWAEALGVSTYIFRSPHDPSLFQHHMADRYSETLLPWQISPGAGEAKKETVSILNTVLRSSRKHGQTLVDRLEERVIILHPGSGSRIKCASPELLAKVVRRMLIKPTSRLCLVGGPADVEILQTMEDVLGDLDLTILKNLDLLTMSYHLTNAQLFIGHDSGLSHLAACLGVPSLLLFGPTDPSIWAPRGEHVRVLRRACHCCNREAMEQCFIRPCLAPHQDEVIQQAEFILSGVQALV